MARPRKTQETMPQIVDEESSFSISEVEDETPVFDEDEENFNAKDLEEITMIAEKIVSENREVSSTRGKTDESRIENLIESFREEITSALDSLNSAFAALSNKVDSLILREDTSKSVARIVTIFDDLVPLIERIEDRMSSPALQAPKASSTPSKSFNEEEVEKVRKWVRTIPKGKSASLSTVVSEIDKRLNLGATAIETIIAAQTDIVKVADGRIHGL